MGLWYWKRATGRGASQTFDRVEATDISANQLANAHLSSKITYSLQPAEQTNFPDSIFDLVTVAQAIHWFDFERFYQEVKRVTKPNALLVVVGYGGLKINPALDAVIGKFYQETLGTYWDYERRYIDENYQSIPFPFKELAVPAFESVLSWTFEHLVGYLKTWSAVKHFEQVHGYNPVDVISLSLAQAWGAEQVYSVRFPILLRVGKIH